MQTIQMVCTIKYNIASSPEIVCTIQCHMDSTNGTYYTVPYGFYMWHVLYSTTLTLKKVCTKQYNMNSTDSMYYIIQ